MADQQKNDPTPKLGPIVMVIWTAVVAPLIMGLLWRVVDNLDDVKQSVARMEVHISINKEENLRIEADQATMRSDLAQAMRSIAQIQAMHAPVATRTNQYAKREDGPEVPAP